MTKSSLKKGGSILLRPVNGTSRSHYFSTILLAFLTTTQLHAILDTNGNSLSDLWEAAHNNQQLFNLQNPNHQPTADPDGDGWTNLEEATAGTDPFNPNLPGGMLHPEFAHHPATYGDLINGIPELVTPEAISLIWPTVPGKSYRLQHSFDLTPASWTSLPEILVGTGQIITFTLPLTQVDGLPPESLYWRISVADLDNDGDTLTNSEEIALNTDPNHSDSDLDGIPDNLDSAQLDSATFADPDGLGLANANLLVGLKANWSFEENTIPIANLFGKIEARCENHAPATTPSWPVLVPISLSGGSVSQRRGFVSRGLPIADKSIFGDAKIFTGITSSFTLSFWHRFQKDSVKDGNHIYKCLWSLSDCRPAQSSIHSNTLAIRKKNSTEEEIYIGAYTWSGSGGNPHSSISGKSFTRPLGTADDGKWHHYTIVRSSGKFTLIIDGVIMPGLDNATVPWLDIPLNKPAPTAPTDYTYDWNTFGRMAPSLAHNQTLGTFDRIRLWSRPLTSNETISLYQEDIDNDGLWDVTEDFTMHWLDENSDGVATEQEIFHHASPLSCQKADHDTDGDKATDQEEQVAGTQLWNPDTDTDLIPDGWELSVSMNPHSSADANLDPDGDGATNIEEFRHNTNPNVSDTDGDSMSDGQEINGPDGNPETDDGSDPNDPSDNGVRRPDDQLVFFKIGVGDRSTSQSEDYVLNVFRYTEGTALEARVFTLRSGGFGEYKEITRAFRKNHLYTFQIQWLGSSRNITPSLPSTAAQKPDYDYHMVVESQQGTLGLFADSFDPDARTYDPNFKILDPEDVLPSDDDDDNVVDLPHSLTPRRVLFVPVIFERDVDVLDSSWQPMSGQLTKALPGQKINLRVSAPMLPRRLQMSDYEWILPQTTFKDYTANQTEGKLTLLESDDLKGANVSFYFVSSGSFSTKAKFALNGSFKEVDINMEVEQPIANFNRKLGVIKFISDMSGGLRLGLFENAMGDYYGIIWEGDVFVPSGWPQGKWNWVQTGTPNISAVENSGNAVVYSTNGLTGLDTRYPTVPYPPAPHPGAAFGYPTGAASNPSNTYGASPSIPVKPYKQCSYAASFTTYLMFLPDGSDSRYVPLKVMEWDLSFSASKDSTDSWNIQSQSVNAGQSQATTDHPQWSLNISDDFVNQ